MRSKILLLFACMLIPLCTYAEIVTTAEKGKDYTFDFKDESIISKDAPGNTTIDYGILRIYCGPTNAYKYNGAQHGVAFKAGNYLELDVAGNVLLKIGGCQYNKVGTIIVSDTNGTYSESFATTPTTCDGSIDYNYQGGATTLKILFDTETYVPQIEVKAVAETEPSNGLIDVWDLGAEQLDETKYNNHLNADIINSWYTGSEPGTTGISIPGENPEVLEAGNLKFIIKGAGDRHYTCTPGITCYGTNYTPAEVGGIELNGCLYFNTTSTNAQSRCVQIKLEEDDEVFVYAKAQSGDGVMHFDLTSNASLQADEITIPQNGIVAKFVAKQAGTYSLYTTNYKPFIYRIERRDAAYATVSGNVTATTIPSGCGIVFTNEAGKSWTAMVNEGSYTAELPQGYTYEISLLNANGYIVSNGTELTVGTNATQKQDIVILEVDLITVTGSISGIDANIGQLGLAYTPDEERVFIPVPVINAASKTYSVQIEPNVAYTISAEGVNDYQLTNKTVNIPSGQTMDLVFEAKPVYAVALNMEGLSEEQKTKMGVTFTNLNEEGYTYTFATLTDIKLRDGVYAVVVSGLNEYPLQQALTSNLKVEGEATTKSVTFKPVSNWTFDDMDISGTSYKGLSFTGTVRNEKAKGHLTANSGSTITIPVDKGGKLTVTYYYYANISVNGGDAVECTTSAGSTSKTESIEYINNADNAVVLTIGGDKTTYITDIKVSKVVPYAKTISVGIDKEYRTINAALDAVRSMNRPDGERVEIRIEPGNYEEMLVVDVPNVSLINASLTPSIALKNKGVDIDDNAVRITAYYGHGYNYYSMNNQKWDEETLRVNKENGYLSYVNKGSGTTNGSYWNATVVVSANGFEAENIIFENSYNQYISKKESEDIVELSDGNKGVRPTEYGSTAVQDKSFVERAAAIALIGSDKVILNNCRVIGRQDSFYGGDNVRAAIYKGVMMGGTDYIFGEMTAVFYKTQLALNTSEDKNDVAYITAAKQNSGRGYLMYECTVTSAEPGVETASAYRSKPGYFGRPWQPTTSEVVFYKTTIETSNNPEGDTQDKGNGDYLASYNDASLIRPIGWNSSLSGESPLCYEYGTIEKSGVNNSEARVGWSTVLTEPVLSGETSITTLNFTKGNDGWEPFDTLIKEDPTSISGASAKENALSIYAYGTDVYVEGIQAEAIITVYSMDGALVKTLRVNENTKMPLSSGLWIIKVSSAEGNKSAKVMIK